jgi:RNA polymerase sigma factor (sigma-70 family)
VASAPSEAVSLRESSLSPSASFTRMGDCELLERFASRTGEKDESAELAFATLVARHGPMVLRVCRAGLGDSHAAEDAFQATFLVLARRAGSIRRGRSLGSWLHGVALRVAACARSQAARRRHHERRRAELIARGTHAEGQSHAADDDSGRVVNEEINRLPERFRSAVVLCYLEGLTHEMAADQLGCPVGTVRSRLATARDRLRRRLTRRGLAPLALPVESSVATLASGSEFALSPVTVPAALADGTIRGALHMGLGKGALAGLVSADTVILVNEAVKTAMTAKLTLCVTAVLVAAIAIGGLSHLKPFGLRRIAGRAGEEVDGSKQSAPGDPHQTSVRSLIKESEAEFQGFLRSTARSPDKQGELWVRHTESLAKFASALFKEAELNPKTPLAEEALVWIVTHHPPDPIVQRAMEIIIRDHIQSESIEPLFNLSKLILAESTTTERLLREGLAKNPHRAVQGLVCFTLARYLDLQSSSLCRDNSIEPAQRAAEQSARAKEVQAYLAHLNTLGSAALDREATKLYERVVTEFGDLPSREPLPNLTESEFAGAKRATLGEIAEIYLNDVKNHGIGKPAPEIEGVDLDDRPMKLSDYRGKVVVLYFGGPVPPSDDAANFRAAITAVVQKVAERHANDPLAVLGVSTINPGPSAGREAYRWSMKARGLPARFWWDLDPRNRPGPIQTMWNARGQIDLYVLDHKGVIRYKHYFGPEYIEKAVITLLKEQKDELARTQKGD